MRPDRILKGNPVKTEVTLVDYEPVIDRQRTVPVVRVSWWRETTASKCPCALYQTNIWFLHLSPGSTNIYSIVGTQDISAEQKILEALADKK